MKQLYVNQRNSNSGVSSLSRKPQLFVSKYLEYLPEELQMDMHVAHEIDIDGVREFLEKYRVRVLEG